MQAFSQLGCSFPDEGDEKTLSEEERGRNVQFAEEISESQFKLQIRVEHSYPW